MPDIKEKIVPDHQEGGKKDIEHKVTAIDDNDAKKLFFITRNRLLDVNRWHELIEGVTAKFILTDDSGKTVHRTAEIDDFFKIDVPGPGSKSGEGYDWVHIESIEEQINPDGDEESIGMRVRPSKNPENKGENIAHFFNEEATSSFVIIRKGKTVTAAVFGRNEKPNTETQSIVDKVRNALVGTGAILGLSNVQWTKLVKSLIATEP